jgi:hypothetical protein
LEEETKLEFTITVNWRREDGNIATTQLGTPSAERLVAAVQRLGILTSMVKIASTLSKTGPQLDNHDSQK